MPYERKCDDVGDSPNTVRKQQAGEDHQIHRHSCRSRDRHHPSVGHFAAVCDQEGSQVLLVAVQLHAICVVLPDFQYRLAVKCRPNSPINHGCT